MSYLNHQTAKFTREISVLHQSEFARLRISPLFFTRLALSPHRNILGLRLGQQNFANYLPAIVKCKDICFVEHAIGTPLDICPAVRADWPCCNLSKFIDIKLNMTPRHLLLLVQEEAPALNVLRANTFLLTKIQMPAFPNGQSSVFGAGSPRRSSGHVFVVIDLPPAP
ncbi:hypothetical protein CIRG_06643 [Coccidioides immitis RMSCC 2394]|uniref:Uncharacterized protein n=1 Tax=Coccidioides immitis RMSCC 2394 TaxID=404692 RepID=A0A0J7BA96_COCIT|nr:hypothetical protein CIRG_06643 [Coccidioides immitis RMSCC 2394]